MTKPGTQKAPSTVVTEPTSAQAKPVTTDKTGAQGQTMTEVSKTVAPVKQSTGTTAPKTASSASLTGSS